MIASVRGKRNNGLSWEKTLQNRLLASCAVKSGVDQRHVGCSGFLIDALRVWGARYCGEMDAANQNVLALFEATCISGCRRNFWRCNCNDSFGMAKQSVLLQAGRRFPPLKGGKQAYCCIEINAGIDASQMVKQTTLCTRMIQIKWYLPIATQNSTVGCLQRMLWNPSLEAGRRLVKIAERLVTFRLFQKTCFQLKLEQHLCRVCIAYQTASQGTQCIPYLVSNH